MEAGYIGGTSVMMFHGSWVWDKALAAGSTFDQRGWPCTPPAKGNDTWWQYATPPGIDWQFFIRSGNEEQPQWPQVQHAWNWFFSPKVVAWRAQAEGRAVIYRLDEPLDIQGPLDIAQRNWEETYEGLPV